MTDKYKIQPTYTFKYQILLRNLITDANNSNDIL